jgi:hypothetical protein
VKVAQPCAVVNIPVDGIDCSARATIFVSALTVNFGCPLGNNFLGVKIHLHCHVETGCSTPGTGRGVPKEKVALLKTRSGFIGADWPATKYCSAVEKSWPGKTIGDRSHACALVFVARFGEDAVPSEGKNVTSEKTRSIAHTSLGKMP